MLVLGHAGFTVAAAILADTFVRKRSQPGQISTNGDNNTDHLPRARSNPQDPPSAHAGSSLAYALRYMDIRLLILGSLLPDIIDKPVGLFFFRQTFSNGRIFSHTLLFLVVLTAVALYLFTKHHKAWLIPLSFGTLMHLILDQIWQTPQTLFWPLFGIRFETRDTTDWLTRLIHSLLTDPATYVPELIGAIILLSVILVLVRRRRLSHILKQGICSKRGP